MRKVLLFLCVAALLQGVAFGDVVGSWAKTTTGSTDVWTLTVKPMAGEDIRTFDGWVYTSATTFDVNPSPPISGSPAPGSADTYAVVDAYTHFLVQLGHGSGKTGVTDALEVSLASGVDSTDLYALVGALPNAGGIYYNGGIGWTSAFALLQVAVPTAGDPFYPDATVGSGLHGLSASAADSVVVGDNAHIVWIDPDSIGHQVVFNAVPEPCTLALLGCGLFGLLAYAWRKRK